MTGQYIVQGIVSIPWYVIYIVKMVFTMSDGGATSSSVGLDVYKRQERWDYYEQATYAMRLINETTPLSLLRCV